MSNFTCATLMVLLNGSTGSSVVRPVGRVSRQPFPFRHSHWSHIYLALSLTDVACSALLCSVLIEFLFALLNAA